MGRCRPQLRLGGRTRAALWALTVCLVASLPAAAAGEPLLTINQIAATAMPDVVVYLTVSDASGIPIEGLTEASFEVFEAGQPITTFQASAVDQSQESIAAILAIDTSGSMKGQPLLDAQEAAKSFIRDLAAGDQVAVLSFGAAVQLAQDFTTDRNQLDASIDALEAKGDTALYDALYEAVGYAAHLPPGRKMVLALTDGEDTESSVTLDDAIDRAKELNVPVFAVGLGQIVEDPLKRLTKLTGGRYFAALSSAELTERFTLVASQLRHQYVIRYRSQVVPDGREHTLVIKVTHQGKTSQDSRTFTGQPVRPTVALPGLTEGMDVRGVVEILPELVPPDYVTRVEYVVDGAQIAAVTQPPFGYRWIVDSVAPGSHTLTVKAVDLAGNTAEASVGLRVVAPLSLRITHPTEGKVVKGKVLLTVSPDPDGVAEQVEYSVDGELLATVSTFPFTYEWDTSKVTPGAHTVTAVASGQGQTASAEVSVVVEGAGLPWGLIVGLAVLAVAAVPFLIMARRRTTAEPAALRPTRPLSVPSETVVVSPAWLEDVGGRRWPLRSGRTLIGRQAGPGGVQLDDPLASREHAEVRQEGGAYVFRDLGPTNPSLVNGQEASGANELQDGDEITIGETVLIFRQEG